MAGRDPHRGTDFRVARIGTAVVFTVLFVCLSMVDALNEAYVFSSTNQLLLAALILTLLGLELKDIWRGGGA